LAPAEDWQEKVKRYTRFEVVNVKGNPKKTSSREAQMAAESDKVLSMLGSSDFVVVLDERGSRATSHDFAHLLARAGALVEAPARVAAASR